MDSGLGKVVSADFTMVLGYSRRSSGDERFRHRGKLFIQTDDDERILSPPVAEMKAQDVIHRGPAASAMFREPSNGKYGTGLLVSTAATRYHPFV